MILLFVILLPIYFFGLLSNYLPYKLPAWIFRALKLDIEYKASFQMILGMILFPAFYFCETLLFRKHCSEEFFYTLLFVIALPLSGFVAKFSWLILQRTSRMLRYLFKLSTDKKIKIINLRDELLKILHLEMEKIM